MPFSKILVQSYKIIQSHRGRKHFCGYCLQAFSKTEILKSQANDCFKINGKEMIKMP